MYQRIVIKVGTSTLTAGQQHLSMPLMVELVRQIATLRQSGRDVILVSSGGIAAGRELMHHPKLPHYLPAKQMLAAVGQPRLMAIYTQLFALYDQKIAQVLLTREDLAERMRYLNARTTLEALLDYQIIPIINENDTIATEEIRFGDNDNLSALVSNILESDMLILLTDQEGVFTADPRLNHHVKIISEISDDHIPHEILKAASESSNGLGTGGMVSKLSAADLARRSGAEVVVANGCASDVLIRLAINEEKLGTHFTALGTHLESRKRYLLSGMKTTAGTIKIDEGAVDALRKGGSLLPVGITSVKGNFSRGESVTIADSDGDGIAVGLSNYQADEIKKIAGKHSDKIETVLGYAYGAEVVHHNSMVLL